MHFYWKQIVSVMLLSLLITQWGQLSAEEPALQAPDVYATNEDKDFDKYISLADIANAINQGDAATLATLAADLQRGELELGRTRKGISVEAILLAAIRFTGATTVPETWGLLEKTAAAAKKDNLIAMIKASRETTAVSRAANPKISIDPDGDLSGLLAYQNFMQAIQQAQAMGDKEALGVIREGLEVGPEMEPQLVIRLKKTIDEAKSIVQESPSLDILRQLSSASRGSSGGGGSGEPQVVSEATLNSLSANNRNIFKFCRSRVGSKVGSGQCAALNDAAIEYVSKKSFSPQSNPADGDYVWGNRIGILTSGKIADVSKIRPGDMLQFRNVKLKGSTGGTSYYTQTATHHSAVVHSLGGNGIVYVFEQNTGGRMYVTYGTYRMRDLQSGTIWISRW